MFGNYFTPATHSNYIFFLNNNRSDIGPIHGRDQTTYLDETFYPHIIRYCVLGNATEYSFMESYKYPGIVLTLIALNQVCSIWILNSTIVHNFCSVVFICHHYFEEIGISSYINTNSSSIITCNFWLLLGGSTACPPCLRAASTRRLMMHVMVL